TRMKRPSVSTVTGRVRMMRIGRTTVFARPRSAAAMSAVPKLSMRTDGIRYATARSASVCSNQTTTSLSASLPQARGHRQARIVARGERAVRRDAESLEHRHDLARMLRRVPGAALHDVVQRLLAVVGLHFRLRCAISIAPPPSLEARAHASAVV